METIRDLIEEGKFPTVQKKALELIDRVNALRKIEMIRREEEVEEKKIVKERNGITRYYIKPIFEMAIGNNEDPLIVKKIGPTIVKEVILARTKADAAEFINKLMDDDYMSQARKEREISKLVVGTKEFNAALDKLRENAEFPVVNFRAFMKRTYSILSRTYLKPSVRALAKPITNFI